MAVENSSMNAKRKPNEVDMLSDPDVVYAAEILVEISRLKYEYDHLAKRNMQQQRNLNIAATDHAIDIPLPDRDIYKGSHICEICGAQFTTGQALGGHKRAHSKQKPPSDATSVAVGPRVVIVFNGKRLVN
jgi:C2H2-type zinc finger